MKIELDPIGMLIMMAIFLAAVAIIHFLIFKPILKLLAARAALTIDRKDRAAELTRRAEQLKLEYHDKLYLAKAQGVSTKEEIKKKAVVEAKQVLQTTRNQVNQKLDEQREQLAEELSGAQTQLRLVATDMSKVIAEKLLNRSLH